MWSIIDAVGVLRSTRPLGRSWHGDHARGGTTRQKEGGLADWGVGAQLRSIRLERGFTLEQLAEVSGVSVRGISDIERGVRDRPRRSTIDALCDALKVDASTRRELAREQVRRARSESPAESVQPHRVLDFVGRGSEFASIRTHLGSGFNDGVPRTIVIAGPPGVGKTALAIESAQRLRDPNSIPLFLDLLGPNPAMARPPLSVIQALLREVSAPGDDDPPASLEAAVVRWQEACAAKQRTIVLDNAAEEAQIRPVLAGGNVRVVVTSRRSLAGLQGVERVHLDPLPSRDSMSLLREIIPPRQRTDEDIVELARLCSDLPLALRIAGNRIASQPSQTAADFVRRLRSDDRRLRALVAGDLSAEAAFRLSYDDLDAFTADLFRNLCLIYGLMFDTQLVAVLMDADLFEVEEGLDELVELGLLEFIGQRRYRLHDLLRLFSSNELRQEGERAGEAAQTRLRNWLLATARSAAALFEPVTQRETEARPEWIVDAPTADGWLRWNREQWWPAMQHAAQLGADNDVISTAEAFHWYSETWMGWNSWTSVFALSVASARRIGNHRLEAIHLGYLAWADLVEQDDAVSALAHADNAVVAATIADDRLALGWGFIYRGWALNSLGDHEGALTALEGAADLFDSVAEQGGANQARAVAGGALQSLGRPAEAVAKLKHILDEAVKADADTPGRSWRMTEIVARVRMAECLLDIGRPEDALTEAERARSIADAPDFMAGIGRSHLISARAALTLQNMALAASHVAAGLDVIEGSTRPAARELRARFEALDLS
jgi:transcriptional regulator with XRE-family HTH domain/tetratricopeptide (TPR) repeat protein